MALSDIQRLLNVGQSIWKAIPESYDKPISEACRNWSYSGQYKHLLPGDENPCNCHTDSCYLPQNFEAKDCRCRVNHTYIIASHTHSLFVWFQLLIVGKLIQTWWGIYQSAICRTMLSSGKRTFEGPLGNLLACTGEKSGSIPRCPNPQCQSQQELHPDCLSACACCIETNLHRYC